MGVGAVAILASLFYFSFSWRNVGAGVAVLVISYVSLRSDRARLRAVEAEQPPLPPPDPNPQFHYVTSGIGMDGGTFVFAHEGPLPIRNLDVACAQGSARVSPSFELEPDARVTVSIRGLRAIGPTFGFTLTYMDANGAQCRAVFTSVARDRFTIEYSTD